MFDHNRRTPLFSNHHHHHHHHGSGFFGSFMRWKYWKIVIVVLLFLFLSFVVIMMRSTGGNPNENNQGGANRLIVPSPPLIKDDQKLTITNEKKTRNDEDAGTCKEDNNKKSALQCPMKFMHILIPTVSREALPPSVDYLTPTIEHLMDQLPRNEGDALSVPHQVQIWLINHNKPQTPHVRFEALKNEYERGDLIRFVSSKPTERHAEDKKSRIYQQTVDFLWSIKYLNEKNKESPARYTLFMEDDFTLCANGMFAMQYLINKASDYYPDWVSLRVSYGLNGVIVKTSEIPNIIAYYERALAKHGRELPRPPDHMIYFYAEEQRKQNNNRPLIAYRSNLFSHIGDISTFTGREKRYNPNCHQVLYDWLQEGERFRNEDCPLDDISPCTPPNERVKARWSRLVAFNSDADKLHMTNPEHFPLCEPKTRSTEEAVKLKCRIRN